MYSLRDTCKSKWVSPFGNLRFSVCLPTYRSLSQATTSFIAFYRLGIHHMRLVTWSYNLKCFHTQDTIKQPIVALISEHLYSCLRIQCSIAIKLLKINDTKSQQTHQMFVLTSRHNAN